MPLSAETKNWLDALEKEGNLSPEVVKGLREAAEANPKSDEFLKGSVLRQNDYSRVIADVKKGQKDLETAQEALKAKEAAVSKFQTELGTWKQGAEQSFDKALREREAADRKAQAALSRLKTIAEANGLSVEEVVKDLDTTPNSPNPNPNSPNPSGPDMSKYLTKEEVLRAQNEAGILDAMVHDLAAEYQELYGKPPKNMTELVREAITAQKPLRQFCEDKWKFSEKRTELADADIKRRIDEAVAAKEAELRSSLPLQQAPRPGEQRSPVLESTAIRQAAETPESGGVSAAIAAYQQGKYRMTPGRG